MAEKTLNAVLQSRNDTEANFRIGNPILVEGEMAISLDKGGQFKVGDGVNAWMDLSYNVATPTAHTHTASEVGLGNVTNNAQVKGLASGTTSGHVVTWGADGYTVADSGYTIATSVPANALFTDINVTNNVDTTTKAYLVASTSNTDATGTLIKDTGVYLDTTAGSLVCSALSATSISGTIDGGDEGTS